MYRLGFVAGRISQKIEPRRILPCDVFLRDASSTDLRRTMTSGKLSHSSTQIEECPFKLHYRKLTVSLVSANAPAVRREKYTPLGIPPLAELASHITAYSPGCFTSFTKVATSRTSTSQTFNFTWLTSVRSLGQRLRPYYHYRRNSRQRHSIHGVIIETYVSACLQG